MLVISWFLCGVLYSIFYCYVFSKIVCQEQFLLDKKVVCGSIVFGFCYSIIKYIGSGYIQPYFTQLLIFAILKIIYQKSFVKTIIGVLSLFIISCISELLFAMTLNIINVNAVELTNKFFGYFISNVIILAICIEIANIKYVKNLIFYITAWYNDDEFKNSLILVLMAITILIFLMYNNFVHLLPSYFLYFTNAFCLCVLGFVIGFFKEKSDKNRIKTDYDRMMSYVKVYENVVDEKSKNQHEHKNQLVVIREMIIDNDDGVIDYINKKIDNIKEDVGNEWLNRLKYVPLGGLKGLIHYKIQEMLKQNVKIYVDVSPQLKKYEKNKDLYKELDDISRIIGIYLDNSIQAVKDLIEKFIIIEFYIEDGFIVFSLSNNYNGIIDVSKLDNERYTTKGDGHGYGLSLVKDILSKNRKLSQKKELNGIYFDQKLYIKIKRS